MKLPWKRSTQFLRALRKRAPFMAFWASRRARSSQQTTRMTSAPALLMQAVPWLWTAHASRFIPGMTTSGVSPRGWRSLRARWRASSAHSRESSALIIRIAALLQVGRRAWDRVVLRTPGASWRLRYICIDSLQIPEATTFCLRKCMLLKCVSVVTLPSIRLGQVERIKLGQIH